MAPEAAQVSIQQGGNAPPRKDGSAMRLLDWLPFGRVPEVSPGDLQTALERADPPLILDVRTGFEFARGHIEGAVPINPMKALQHAREHGRGRPIAVICKTAHRSIPVVRFLRQAGFDARQLAGGMDRWREAGLPVRTTTADATR